MGQTIENYVTGDTIALIDDNGVIDIQSTLALSGTQLTATAAELNALDGNTATATELSEYSVTAYMADAGTAGSVFVVLPHAGTVRGLSVVNYEASTTTKTVFTAEIGGTPITHAAWELALDAAAGTKSSVVPSAANTVTADSVLELISDGGTDATMPVLFTVKILR